MRYRHLVVVVAVSGALAAGGFAPSGTEGKEAGAADEAAIRRLGTDWQDAWNRHDAEAMASLLAEDVEFITVGGPKGWLRGRRQFTEDHAVKHRTRFDQSVWTTREVHVRPLRPDLALARVLWETVGDKVPHRKHGERREGIFTWVVEKKEGKWRIIASQNTESMPVLPGQ